jgi:hypothetical protein
MRHVIPPTRHVTALLGARRDGGYEYTLTDGQHRCQGWRQGTRQQVLDYLDRFQRAYNVRQQMSVTPQQWNLVSEWV